MNKAKVRKCYAELVADSVDGEITLMILSGPQVMAIFREPAALLVEKFLGMDGSSKDVRLDVEDLRIMRAASGVQINPEDMAELPRRISRRRFREFLSLQALLQP